MGTASIRRPAWRRGAGVDLGPGHSRTTRSSPYRRTRSAEGVRGTIGALACGLEVVPSSHPRTCCLLARSSGDLYAIWGSWSEAAPPALLEGPLLFLPLFLLILTLTDGLGEELAWRGFALPRLLTRYNALVASVVLGVIWALWHLPLLWTDGNGMFHLPVWLLLLDVTAKSVLFTWVFLHTRGSVLIAMLFHGATNLFLVSPEVASTGDLGLPVLAMVAKWVLVGIVLVVAAQVSREAPTRKRCRELR